MCMRYWSLWSLPFQKEVYQMSIFLFFFALLFAEEVPVQPISEQIEDENLRKGFFLAPLHTQTLSDEEQDSILQILYMQILDDRGLTSESLTEETRALSQDSAKDYIRSCVEKDSTAYQICISEVAAVNQWLYALSIDIRKQQSRYFITTWIINTQNKEEIGTTELEVHSLEEWGGLVALTSQKQSYNVAFKPKM